MGGTGKRENGKREREYRTPRRRAATTRSCANARTTTRKGSITAVVSDTVDRLEKRTVPESALLPIDPATYTGAHARRRLVPLDLDRLPPPTP
ncbi:hypothetical protein SCHPADRAFT_904018 [Schizopora paradoxa]|uniref:Uncharacterized protein n=1 Tax=Schizopora paradoxa TaxID=27342 RepID=A0A0H2RP86_9AGAM|nr:hypothetical protein SCHPADRAFT_904018 [Schizopora paradoxa]